MLTHAASAGHALWRRAVEEGNAPSNVTHHWAFIVVFLAFLCVLPFLVIADYALKNVYPVLAIVEDENPPAYEPVPLDEDGAPILAGGMPKPLDPEPVGTPRAVTSSVRSVHRLLKAHGGLRGYTRGFACMFVQGILTSVVISIMSAFVGFHNVAATAVGIVAPLALVQFSTAWVHIVITKPSRYHFWSRLPEFQRTFRATWKAVLIHSIAARVSLLVPFLVAMALHLKVPDMENDKDWKVSFNGNAAWKGLIVLLVATVTAIFITIPAFVVLVRVQASLLPEHEETIVPFDRSFQGKVEPAVVGGTGYVSVTDAWSTFSRAAWRRLVILYAKVTVILSAITMVVVGCFAVAVFTLVLVFGTKQSDPSGSN